MNILEKTIQIAIKAHEGQKDLNGEAYILHPLAVGLMGNTDEERCVGFLHDVLEDTSYDEQEMKKDGINDGVLKAVKILTKEKNEDYFDYIQKIIDSNNPIALNVKFNDLTHNFKRCQNNILLREKYGKALEIIGKVKEERNRVGIFNIDEATKKGNEVATFAAGCFWGVQHYFQKKKGVVKSIVGYTGGKEQKPKYEDVRNHKTSHLEAVLVEFDPKIITYTELCKLFFEIHDPAQMDGQGTDIGSQYLSAVFYYNKEQLTIIKKLISILQNKKYEVNTKVLSATEFWTAEEYHQDYYEKTGGNPYCHIRQKKFD